MRRRKAHRTAAVLAAVAIHAVLLVALAIGIPWTPKVEPEAPVTQVTLERPVAPETPKKPPPPSPKKPRATPTLAPSPVSPPPAAPHVTPAPAPPTGVDAGEAAEMGNVARALRSGVGCANPDAVGLSPAEREKCRRELRATVGEVKPMSGLTAEKRERFDRAVRCSQEYDNAQVPSSFSKSEEPDDMTGMGHVPRMRDCPPSAR